MKGYSELVKIASSESLPHFTSLSIAPPSKPSSSPQKDKLDMYIENMIHEAYASLADFENTHGDDQMIDLLISRS
jgi:hypothetical protein